MVIRKAGLTGFNNNPFWYKMAFCQHCFPSDKSVHVLARGFVPFKRTATHDHI